MISREQLYQLAFHCDVTTEKAITVTIDGREPNPAELEAILLALNHVQYKAYLEDLTVSFFLDTFKSLEDL